MCTVLLARDVVGPRTLLFAANRDEDPARPTDGPRVLGGSPRIVGGRDRRAGGTWLAIREGRTLLAVLNRRPHGPGPAAAAPLRKPPSRGLVALAALAAGDGTPATCAAAASLLLRQDPYAPCTLIVAGAEGAFAVGHRGFADRSIETLVPGWHVVTHENVDDPGEPRTAWLLGELAGFRPHSIDEALARMGALLASHGGPAPAVCLHDGPMQTVSTARVVLTGDDPRYFHGEGPACRASLEDFSPLLRATAAKESA